MRLRTIGGRRRVGDQAVHVRVHVAICAIEAGAVVVPGEQRSPQKIDPALEAAEVAAGARIGEGLIVVVECLAEEAAPHRRRKQRARTRHRPPPGRQAIRRDRRLNGATIPLVSVADPIIERAEDAEPQLPRQRLHDTVGGEFGPDDWKGDARRQRIWWRRGWQDWRLRRKHAATTAATAATAAATHEGRAQEPVIGAARHTALEQPIVKVSSPQFTVREGERARRGSGPIDRAHHLNAVGCGKGTRSAGIRNAQQRVAGRCAAIDDKFVGRRSV